MAGTLPVGCRFRPTEEEIIYLLRLKVTSQQLPPTIVVEKTLYGNDAEPWKVFSDDDYWQIFDDSGKKSTKRMVYVFANLSKIGAKKIARTAGCGRWDGQSKVDVLNSHGQVIGSMKMLNYVLNSGSPVKGGWIMHEYSLVDASLNGIGSTDCVICRIIRDDEKYTQVKKMAAAAKQEVNQDGSMRCDKNPKVSGKRSNPNIQQENSQPSKILKNTSTNATDLAIVSSIELPTYEEQVMRDEIGMNARTTYMNLLLEDVQPINLIDSHGHDSGLDDDHMVHSTALLNGRLLQDVGSIQPEAPPSQHAEQCFNPHQCVRETSNNPKAAMVSTEIEQAHSQSHDPIDYGVLVMACQDIQEDSMIDAKENCIREDTLDPVRSVNQATATESSENLNKSIEVQVPFEQTSSASVECGDDTIAFQAMVNNFFNDDQPITLTDEWFKDALQCCD